MERASCHVIAKGERYSEMATKKYANSTSNSSSITTVIQHTFCRSRLALSTRQREFASMSNETYGINVGDDANIPRLRELRPFREYLGRQQPPRTAHIVSNDSTGIQDPSNPHTKCCCASALMN